MAKTYYKDLTNEQARDWLIRKDKEEAEFWRDSKSKTLAEDVYYNIRDFGTDDEVTIHKPRPSTSKKLTAYQKQENKLRRSFERHFRLYSYDFTWDKELGYTSPTTAATFLGYQIGHSHGARK